MEFASVPQSDKQTKPIWAGWLRLLSATPVNGGSFIAVFTSVYPVKSY